MKIALIHFRMLLLGGLETRLFSYIEWLKAQGHSVTFIVSKISNSIQVPSDIEIVQISRFPFPKVSKQKRFDRAVCKYMSSHSFDYRISLGRTSCQDVVLAPGNHLGYLQAMKLNGNRKTDRIQIELDRKAYAGSKHIFAASKMMQRELIDLYGVSPTKISVLYPPIDSNRFNQSLQKQKQALRKKYGLAEDKFSLLFVSTGHERKGLPFLIKIMEALDPTQFELVVSGNSIPSGLNANIRELGFIAQTEELYAAADCTIHPAKYEPYGQVVAESILCGTPVLVSGMTGAGEIVTDQEGKVIDGFDLGDWVEAILQVKANEYLINKNFASQNSLEIDQHMRKLLQFAPKS